VKRTAEEREGQDRRCGRPAGACVGQMHASRGAPAAGSRAQVCTRAGSRAFGLVKRDVSRKGVQTTKVVPTRGFARLAGVVCWASWHLGTRVGSR
jgi:hypothetical protein